MRIAIVGAGLAGALLAVRLCQASSRPTVEILDGNAPGASGADATGASGGLVRGFERDPASGRLAVESLLELRASAVLREWSAYREIGSVYLLPGAADVGDGLAVVDHLVPGSATVLDRADLVARYPFQNLPGGVVGVRERWAGHISPARLRGEIMARLAASGVHVHRRPVRAVSVAPAVRTADGVTSHYDAVVVAAGAWTPALLASSGLDRAGLRTRQIQYSVHRGRPGSLGAFVDDTTGLYGRPLDDDGALLVGLPSTRWDVEPAAVEPDPALADAVGDQARRRLRVPLHGPATRVVASFDCYHEPPGLALRRCLPGSPLFTFTGGSGGAAKTALAASRAAAATLLDG
jgi:glycine/D-amino acid oxidase-like deaminating enzyme